MKKNKNNSNKDTKRILICLFLVILWIFLIYFFSDMSSFDSNKLSKGIVNNIVDKTVKVEKKVNIRNEDLEGIERYRKVRDVNFYIRKSAHVLEFLILDLLLLKFLSLIFKDKEKGTLIYYSSVLTFLCTLLDEFHQSFVGRTSQFSDCLIDSIGIVLVIIIFEINKFIKKKKENKKEIKEK